MVKILVVEDEPIIRQDLCFCIADMGHEVLGQAESFEEATELLDGTILPDLILLDVNLEGEKDGIELGAKINALYNIPFIYITSYFDPNTVERAKETCPASYVIKPFDAEDLRVNIDLALYKRKKTPQFSSNKLFVKNNQDLIAINPEEIIYVEADDNYSKVHTEKGYHVISHTLKKVEEKLTSRGFIRIHKSYLINFEKIDTITDGMVYLGAVHLPIGKAYRSGLQHFLVTL